MVAGQVTSLVGVPHGTGPGFPSEKSNSPPVVQQVSLPWHPALVGFANGLSG